MGKQQALLQITMERTRQFILFSSIILTIGTAGLRAQNLSSISGTITDPSGAAVPGVRITVTNQQTGVIIRTTTTNGAGNYSVPDIPNATYTVTATRSGFTRAVRRDVIVPVGATVREDLRLAVGAVTTQVTVTAAPVHLQTQTGSQSATLAGAQVAAIDINGRNFTQLATLVPGATGAQVVGTLNPAVGSLENRNIYFNGEQSDHNVWMIDGQENYDRGSGGAATVVPDQDAIQEFTVQDSANSPNVGFGSGAHIQLALKSGTDQFHGEAFEFNRNTAFDASTFFANEANEPTPTLNFNDYGFNLGGPIFLPGHAKKLFFFFDADWRHLIQPTTINALSAPTAWASGDFSGSKITVLNPASAAPCPGNPSLTCKTPFPGNVVNTPMDSNALLLAKPNFLLPTPNVGQFYDHATSEPTNVAEQILRVDYNLSQKTSLMFHFIRNGNLQTEATSLWNNDTYPTIGSQFINNPQFYEVQLTRSINPTLLNEIMVGFQRQPINVLPTGNYVQPSGLALKPLYPGTNTDNRVPALQFQGSALGTNVNTGSWPWDNVLNDWTVYDSLSKIKGNHSFSFGGTLEHYLKQQELFGNTEGQYSFNGSFTGGNYVGPGGTILTSPGNEYADFLLGDVYNYQELQDQTTPAYITNLFAFWGGDTWKVHPNLTLNLGLRWEGMPHTYAQYNQVAVFKPSLYNPADAPKFNANGSLIPTSSPSFVNGEYLNGMATAGTKGVPAGLGQNHWATFEPRVGFAWSPSWSRNTVIRGAYGIFYENIQGNDIYDMAPNPPFSNTPSIFSTNFTNPGLVPGSVFPASIQSLDPLYLQPYSQQWNFGIQHQFGTKILASLAYVGSKGTDEQITTNINQPLAPVPSGAINQARPYAGFSNLAWFTNSTSSTYNSVQGSLQFTTWHGLTGGVNYTWSHCLDFSDGDASGIQVQDSYNIGAEYGNCGYNVFQTANIDYVYALPFFRSATGAERTLLGGWQLSGLTTLYTGSMFTAGAPGDPAQCGCSNYRANEIGNPNAGSGIHTPSEWFNTAAFASLATGTFGNGARNTIYGAPINNWDISLFKNFSGIPFPASKEGATLQLRFEFYNIFNTVQFNAFNLTQGVSGFGAATGALDPREIQFGAKFMF